MKTVRKYFSLVEMMLVIGIIIILVGILVPVVSTMKSKARETKAKAEMMSIVTAIKSYESTYSVLPDPSKGSYTWTNGDISDSGESSGNSGYARLMTLLTDVPYKIEIYPKGGYPTEGVEGPLYNYWENSRNIRFLDVPSDYPTEGYLDPWGQPYQIYMDTNYDDELTGPEGDTLYGTVFVVTPNPDGKNIFSWK